MSSFGFVDRIVGWMSDSRKLCKFVKQVENVLKIVNTFFAIVVMCFNGFLDVGTRKSQLLLREAKAVH